MAISARSLIQRAEETSFEYEKATGDSLYVVKTRPNEFVLMRSRGKGRDRDDPFMRGTAEEVVMFLDGLQEGLFTRRR